MSGEKLAGSMNVCKNELNAKIRQLIDLRGIYTKKELGVGEFPLDSQQNPWPLDLHHVVERGGHRAVKI